MATLTADVTADAKSWNVSALPVGDYLQVDDEIVHVLDKQRTTNRIRVERGYAGTTAATHSSGATLTPLYIPSTGGGGAGGGVSIMGPFAVLFDGPDLNGSIPNIPLEVGTWVLSVWIVLRDVFEAAGNVSLDVTLTNDNPGSHQVFFLTSLQDEVVAWQDSFSVLGGSLSSLATKAPARLNAGANGGMYVDLNGSPTAGAADIYALIAEPA